MSGSCRPKTSRHLMARASWMAKGDEGAAEDEEKEGEGEEEAKGKKAATKPTARKGRPAKAASSPVQRLLHQLVGFHLHGLPLGPAGSSRAAFLGVEFHGVCFLLFVKA